MPHVVVKMYKGRTPEQKKRLAEGIRETLKKTIGAGESHISVSVEDYDPSEWPQVEAAEIDGRPENLYMRAGKLVK